MIDYQSKCHLHLLVFAGNSAYGRTLVNREHHTDISFQQSSESMVSQLINNKQFRSLNELNNDIIEFESAKSLIKLDVPVQIGFFVLEYGKLALLSFYYDFMIKYLPFDSFSLIEADTDALYFSLSEENLFLTVPVEKRAEFVLEYEHWFAKEFCDEHKASFFYTMFSGGLWEPKDCCKAIAKHDSRTVGKFHNEWHGKGVIALCSKCYYCFGNNAKLSSKGISKTHNQLTEKDYMHVVLNQSNISRSKQGFSRKRQQYVYVYTSQKKTKLHVWKEKSEL